MIKNISLIILFLILLSGCGRWGSKDTRIPTGNKGQAKQSDSEKTKIYGDLEGEITLPEMPLFDDSGRLMAPIKIRVDGVDAELPAGSKGTFKLRASGNSSTYSWTEVSSEWKINSAPTQLFVFGAIMVAAGVILIFFGMTWLGLGVGSGGAALIGCGIMINQYPWVILIVIGIGLVSAGYYLYTTYKKKALVGENKDTNFVLEELTEVLSDMPDDLLETYVKQPLREHDKSDLIRQITRKARLRR